MLRVMLRAMVRVPGMMVPDQVTVAEVLLVVLRVRQVLQVKHLEVVEAEVEAVAARGVIQVMILAVALSQRGRTVVVMHVYL